MKELKAEDLIRIYSSLGDRDADYYMTIYQQYGCVVVSDKSFSHQGPRFLHNDLLTSMRPGRLLPEYMPLLLVYGVIMAVVTPQLQKKGVGMVAALAVGFGAATALLAIWLLFVALQNWRDRRRGS